MSDDLRKKSPRAPSMPLDEAIEKALRVYEKERRHPVPAGVAAQDMGYKSANSGSALQAMASLRYYGLLERPEDGKLAVAKDVEAYNFAPAEQIKRDLLVRWLRTPPVFADLLDKYADGLPSDATLRYDLIQRGFLPIGAESLIPIFRRSVDFVRYFETKAASQPEAPKIDVAPVGELSNAKSEASSAALGPIAEVNAEPINPSLDRIPVRLSGGRRAWLLIPEPFFSADKKRLKDQIDLLLTEDASELQ